jgi:hypothetical protein
MIQTAIVNRPKTGVFRDQSEAGNTEALKAKGYDYRNVYSRATRHCDGKVFEQTLADTLVWMWRGYHAE